MGDTNQDILSSVITDENSVAAADDNRATSDENKAVKSNVHQSNDSNSLTETESQVPDGNMALGNRNNNNHVASMVETKTIVSPSLLVEPIRISIHSQRQQQEQQKRQSDNEQQWPLDSRNRQQESYIEVRQKEEDRQCRIQNKLDCCEETTAASTATTTESCSEMKSHKVHKSGDFGSSQLKQTTTQSQEYQDYSTFAWTKAMISRTTLKNQWNSVEQFDAHGRRKGVPCYSKLPDRYSSAPSSSYGGVRMDKWCGQETVRRNDFVLSSESSSLFAKNKQPRFLFVPPRNGESNPQGDTTRSNFIRLDDYSNGVSRAGSNGAGGGHRVANGVSIAALDFQEQMRIQRERTLIKQRVRRSALAGALIGGLIAIVVLFVFPQFPDDVFQLWGNLFDEYIESRKSSPQQSVQKPKAGSSILPQQRLHQQESEIAGEKRKHRFSRSSSIKCSTFRAIDFDRFADSFRWLMPFLKQKETISNDVGASGARSLISPESSSSSTSRASSNNSPLLVIAGKMTVSGGPCNIAQYNLNTGEWSLEERIQLSLYNSYSGGEVYSLLANYTTNPNLNAVNDAETIGGSPTRQPARRSISTSASSRRQLGSGQLIVVGAFDTTYRNSQVTYCSVGMWDGSQLSKVGEGLCNSALSKGMKITTASLAGPHDVYVAGSFQTQVWSGERNEFVKIFNIAHFNAVEQVWLPLNVGQISCSWCTVTVLALAWDSKRRQLHIAGKFNSIDGRNVPAGLAVYDYDSGHLVAHPGGGLSMKNTSEDGVGTALQLDEDSGVLYVMGSFERLTHTYERCDGLAAYEIDSNRWTCLADAAHTVYPTGGGNMLITPFGLMVAGKTTPSTTWHNPNRPYTIALLNTTLKTRLTDDVAGSNEEKDDAAENGKSANNSVSSSNNTNATASIEKEEQNYHDFNWSWLPGFKGHDEPLHALTNGFGIYEGSVFIAGDNYVARWSYQNPGKYFEDEDDGTSTKPPRSSSDTNHTPHPFSYDDFTYGMESNVSDDNFTYQPAPSTSEDTLHENEGQRMRLVIIDSRFGGASTSSSASPISVKVPVTEILSSDKVRGAIMAISQMMPNVPEDDIVDPGNGTGPYNPVNITIIVYCVSVGCIIGVIGAILCNRNITGALFPFGTQEKDFKGFSLDTLTYSTMENTSMMDAYQRAMKTRYVHHPNLLTIIDPQEIFLQRIIGEGNFGRVWSAKWRTASVAVKEFVFAQAAVAGKSSQQQQIVEEIIGEAGMMAILRHPNVLQLFGCSLTAQAIWIVSELCSLGSLRQLLDDNDRVLPVGLRLNLALQVAEGMTYLHNQVPPIIHRDLKSHNIFVHETFTESEDSSSITSRRKDGSERMETHSTIVARIGDWGSARASLSGSRTMTHGVGTACWLAPEVIKHARSSKFSDVYGYGIVLWELATREEVYQGLETYQIIAKVANENLRPPVPKDCPWKDIMVKCWAENPQDRLEFQEILAELNDLSHRLQESTSGLSNKAGSNSSVN